MKDGIEAVERIKRFHPVTSVIVLIALDGQVYVCSALEAGAAEYSEKYFSGCEPVQADREACSEKSDSITTVL